MLLVVTYHYLAEEPPAAPRAIFPATTALLEQQLEELGRSFDFVSRDDLLRTLDGEAELPERACLVTFDDGLRCQAELALPVLVVDGWEVSGRRVQAALTLTDCTPLAKVQVRAPLGGHAAAELAVPFGRAIRDSGGTLVAGSGPGEWLLLAAPGEGPALTARATGLAARCPGELVTATDITHGRALIRLNGSRGADVLGSIVRARPRTMSYPYGRPVPGAEGFAAAFTTERKVNETFEEPLLLGRFDTNDLPGGRRAD